MVFENNTVFVEHPRAPRGPAPWGPPRSQYPIFGGIFGVREVSHWIRGEFLCILVVSKPDFMDSDSNLGFLSEIWDSVQHFSKKWASDESSGQTHRLKTISY